VKSALISGVIACWFLSSLLAHGNTTATAAETTASSNAHALGEVLWKYAEDDEGRLPSSLDELRKIHPENRLYVNTVLLMPGAVLSELPKGARRCGPDGAGLFAPCRGALRRSGHPRLKSAMARRPAQRVVGPSRAWIGPRRGARWLRGDSHPVAPEAARCDEAPVLICGAPTGPTWRTGARKNRKPRVIRFPYDAFPKGNPRPAGDNFGLTGAELSAHYLPL
jgi:hypothetical protein